MSYARMSLVIWMTSACSGNSEEVIIRSDSAGVEVVTIRTLPAADDPAFLLRSEVSRSIDGSNRGGASEPDVYDPRTIAHFADGTLVVLDGGPAPLVVLSPENSFVRRFSRWGQGPEEINTGQAEIWPGSDSSVVVSDISNGMIKEFHLDGTLLGSWPFTSDGAVLQWIQAVPETGELYAHLWQLSGSVGSRVSEGDSVHRMHPPPPPLDPAVPMPPLLERAPGAGRLFRPRQVFAAFPDGSIITADNSHGRFNLYSADGTLRRVIEVPLSARPIDEREHRDIMREFSTVPGAASSRTRDVSSHYPLFVLMMPLGDSIFALVHSHRSTPAGDPVLEPTTRRWRVFSTTGRYIGILPLPDDFRPSFTFDGGFWGVRIDSLGYPHIEERRILPPFDR